MEIIIREIEEKDYPALLSLWNNELGNKYVTAENIAPHCDRVKNDDRYKTYAALLEADVVGFISSAQTYAVGFDGSYMQITAMVVKTGKQNKGIGTKLIKRMEDYAREKGCYSIGVCSGFKRTGAHAFYECNGFVKGSYAFNKWLIPRE
ncbi:MAG: GNAT family N-acetyltransferase [Oscillospiraceae bacterium]|nr:GNAT family N-acetyltransferase [Oscillospiraceae bacterium]